MYHSVTFGDKNSWDDWHLIPTSRPTIAMPAPKTKYISIPGQDGQIDLYQSLYGFPLYENRTGTIEFVIHDYEKGDWDTLKTEIINYLHGRPNTMKLQDEPNYYYEGYFTATPTSGQWYSSITIGYTLSPFKYPIKTGYSNWDPFTFSLDKTQSVFTVTNGESISARPARGSVYPSFYTGYGGVITIDGSSYSLSRGYTRLGDLRLSFTKHTISFSGQGKCVVDLRGGVL